MEARSYTFPFSIMEQQSGPGGQMSYLLRTPEPGEQRLWTYQSIAHGADRLLYFTWRTCPFGTEQHWHGLIDQDGKDTRRLAEATATAAEVATLPDAFFDARPVRVAAVLRDFDLDVNEKRINTYTEDGRWAFGRWAASLIKRHVPTDFVWTDAEFDGYQLLIAGHLKIVDDALVEKLTHFVRAGGTLVLGAQGGLHDRRLHIEQLTPPGRLADLAGVEVEDWTTLAKGQARTMTFDDGPTVDAIAFAERLRPTTATPVAAWQSTTVTGGGVAATQESVGHGSVIYLGAYLDQPATDGVVDWLMRQAKVAPAVLADEHVECVVREAADGERFFALLNHSAEPRQVAGLPLDATRVIGPSPRDGRVELRAYGVAIVSSSGG